MNPALFAAITTVHMLFSVVVGQQLDGVFTPIPHAFIQCAEIVRHTDSKPFQDFECIEDDCVAADEADSFGAILKTDSKGEMIFTSPPPLNFTYHCAAFAAGFKRWEGGLVVMKNRQRLTIVLEKGR